MSEDDIYLNGINALTGEYLTPPLTPDEVARQAEGKPSVEGKSGWLRGLVKRITGGQLFSLPQDVDPKEVTQGVYTVQPSADVDSPAYAAAAKRLGIANPDSYEAQATDWISIVALTIAKAGEATGTAIRDTVRKITNSDGMKVYTAVDGLAALKQGKDIKYSGASGPCTFTDIGDISDCKFRYNRVDNGAFKFLEVS